MNNDFSTKNFPGERLQAPWSLWFKIGGAHKNITNIFILYVRLLWSVIFELYKIICAFLPLYLFFINRKNYPTVNGLCFTLWNNVLRTVICPWISLRRFNIEGRPSSFLAGSLKFDLDKVIFKNAHILFFRTFPCDSCKKNHS